MSRYVDIAQLTQSVLDSVEEDSSSEKTAAVETPSLQTEVGRAIKAAAEKLRSNNDLQVTSADLQQLVTTAKTANMGSTVGGVLGAVAGMPLGPMGAIGGGMLGANLGGKLTGGAQPAQPQPAAPPQMGAAPPVQNPAAGAAKMGSALGDELRKIATQIRTQGAAHQEIRLTKAAQMLTAAIGLAHLTEGLK